MKDSSEYKMIQRFYGKRVAERSRVPLMNHIDEGLQIMQSNSASEPAMRAFCLHPLLQSDADLLQNYKAMQGVEAFVILLTMEYRRAANAYLCKPHTDDWRQFQICQNVGPLLPEIWHMLYADKVQNQNDFRNYHFGTHPRSKQLDQYFKNWMLYLTLTKED